VKRRRFDFDAGLVLGLVVWALCVLLCLGLLVALVIEDL
jgi:hypothetical protein